MSSWACFGVELGLLRGGGSRLREARQVYRHPTRPGRHRWLAGGDGSHRVVAAAESADVAGGGFAWLYSAQHVGAASAFELIELFFGPLPERRQGRDADASTPRLSRRQTVTDLRTMGCRMEFLDVGAVVQVLRTCVWWVPDSLARPLRHTTQPVGAAGLPPE